MSCNCIQELREIWKKENEDIISVTFDCYPITNLSNKKSPKKTGQRVELDYWYTKKDGSKVKKTQKTFVSHNFCPFCGKSYDELKSESHE